MKRRLIILSLTGCLLLTSCGSSASQTSSASTTVSETTVIDTKKDVTTIAEAASDIDYYSEGCRLYFVKNDEQFDYQEALECFIKAAESGNKEAGFIAANIIIACFDFNPLPKDKKLAEKYLKACSEDNVYAKYLLAIMNGEEPPELNINEDFYSMDYGPAAARITAAYAWDNGKIDDAIRLYETSIELGEVNSLVELAYLYGSEEDGRYDIEKNINYLNEASAKGLITAGLELAWHTYMGIGFQQDKEKAREQLEKLAETNNVKVLEALGDYYYNEEDIDKAIQAYEKSAQMNSSNAMNNLGIIYFDKHNYKKAKEYYEMGVELENAYCMTNLARIYYYGYGVDASAKEAARLYQMAADLGEPDAKRNLGIMYFYGEVTGTPDKEKAFELIKEAADLGAENAQKFIDEQFTADQNVKETT